MDERWFNRKVWKINCPNCNFYTGDIFSIALPKYDALVSKDVFNHISHPRKVLERFDSLVNANGAIIIANRERGQTTKKRIITMLQSLKYQVAEETFPFTPTDKEISSFLDTLPNFNDRHKTAIRKRLRKSEDYYILYARRQSSEIA